jgi:hypothetical protein
LINISFLFSYCEKYIDILIKKLKNWIINDVEAIFKTKKGLFLCLFGGIFFIFNPYSINCNNGNKQNL